MKGMARLLVGMSLGFGLGYLLLWDRPLAPAAMIAAKGAGVGLLALAAATQARERDGWLLAAILALGAIGDVLLEISLAAGALAFAAGHVAAIALYLGNRRTPAGAADWVVAASIFGVGAVLPVLILGPRPEAAAFGAYALLLAGMAASAWLSRFPRPLVAVGALMFVVSDMLIAVRMAREMTALEPAIWLLYYFGQLLIYLGVSRNLARRDVR